ncbi:MAG: hypothetical protein ACJ748_07450 [Flavisolibacter sp.]|jgi:hypothetical protein
MEKQLMITIPNASGEDGLTLACKRGELFRNDEALEKFYRQGYRVHNYTVVSEDRVTHSTEPRTVVKVYLKK